MTIEVQISTSFHDIPAAEWDGLTDGCPLVRHAFFSALEEAGCVGGKTGWQPYPIAVREAGKLVGVAPMYLKSHSYGEYVFDWAWANAYDQSGQQYYPKLIVAIPFTPITQGRLFSRRIEVQRLMARVIIQQMQENDLSSCHVLFPDEATSQALMEEGWLQREGVQFRWQNDAFDDFEQFLAQLSHDKRKKIRQERKKVLNSGVICRRFKGQDIRPEDWDFFYRCYVNTYYQHGSSPYLTRDFFSLLCQRMPQHLMLVIAERHGEPIAAALNLYDDDTLYGRYWGATEFVSGLHFELCYYQAQEFCIEQGIRFFEGGAQGEHKLARGFLPRPTRSFHKMADPDFESAISRFLRHETMGIHEYNDELEERTPFKAGSETSVEHGRSS